MFLEKYVSDFYFSQILDNYDKKYLLSIDEQHFLKIYKLFIEYKFYFIEDIILKYLEIFELDYNIVKEKIELLKEKLGNNYIYIIGNKINYLEEILN